MDLARDALAAFARLPSEERAFTVALLLLAAALLLAMLPGRARRRPPAAGGAVARGMRLRRAGPHMALGSAPARVRA